MNAPRIEKPANKASLALFAISRSCEWLAVIVLFLMMSLIGMDVVARYIFNRPISGTFELIEIMLAVLVFLALPASIRFESHIKVELIRSYGSSLANYLVKSAVTLAVMCVFVLLTIQLYTHAERLMKYGQVSNSLEIPLYLIGFLASACCLICVLLLGRHFCISLRDKP